jgi:hypothetical protein
VWGGLPSGLDYLSSPTGPIKEAQALAARAFGADRTWFLVNGTTVGIQAAIMATCGPADTLVLARNCHMAAFSGMVMAGCRPSYMHPGTLLCFFSLWHAMRANPAEILHACMLESARAGQQHFSEVARMKASSWRVQWLTTSWRSRTASPRQRCGGRWRPLPRRAGAWAPCCW